MQRETVWLGMKVHHGNFYPVFLTRLSLEIILEAQDAFLQRRKDGMDWLYLEIFLWRFGKRWNADGTEDASNRKDFLYAGR